MKKELLTADASYVLISGTDESCLKDLGTRFKDYTAQDLDNLKPVSYTHLYQTLDRLQKYN